MVPGRLRDAHQLAPAAGVDQVGIAGRDGVLDDARVAGAIGVVDVQAAVGGVLGMEGQAQQAGLATGNKAPGGGAADGQERCRQGDIILIMILPRPRTGGCCHHRHAVPGLRQARRHRRRLRSGGSVGGSGQAGEGQSGGGQGGCLTLRLSDRHGRCQGAAGAAVGWRAALCPAFRRRVKALLICGSLAPPGRPLRNRLRRPGGTVAVAPAGRGAPVQPLPTCRRLSRIRAEISSSPWPSASNWP